MSCPQWWAAADDVLGRHRVHVRPVRDGPARTRPAQDADDAVAAHPRGDGQPGRPQLPGHHTGGAPLLPRRLGVPVDVPPQRDQPLLQARHLGVHGPLPHRPLPHRPLPHRPFPPVGDGPPRRSPHHSRTGCRRAGQ
ncbi:hypothetical protein [Streptomyces sp. MCA2]|uniref:hypothetical protein n=1 Tax=Streptomyces sp. MCA2 TaxID=2944805 RepID=UPI0035ABA13A